MSAAAGVTGWLTDVGAPLLAVALLASLAAWYLSFSAARLDRLHQRVQASAAALEAQLLRRSTAAAELAASGVLDPATSLLLASAAAEAVAAGEESARDPLLGVGEAQERAESDLSRALRVCLGGADVEALRRDPLGDALLQALGSAVQRARLARRFHNDAVTQAVRVRGKRVVRWARLAGHAPEPRTVELDDDPPAALVR